MTRILITGSNSFVGNNFIRFSKYSNIESISLRNVSPEIINFNNIDVVLHLAAIVHDQKNNKENYFKINRDLTVKVARQAKSKKIRHFIFMSTIKVYGNFHSDSAPWNEYSTCTPTDHYGMSKYEAELELKKLANKNFIVSIIRTPIVYGNGVKANMQKLIKLVSNFPILPFAKIENRRNFTYIENLIGFIDRIIELKASGTFIAMDNNSLSTTQLIRYLSKYLGKRNILIKLPKLLIKIGLLLLPRFFDRLYGSIELDNSNTKKELNYNPEYTSEEGIKKMIDSYNNIRLY